MAGMEGGIPSPREDVTRPALSIRRRSLLWFADLMADRASHDLPTRTPRYSAMQRLYPAQGRVLARIAAIIGVVGLSVPIVLIVFVPALLLLGFATLIAWRIILLFASIGAVRTHEWTPDRSDYLPIYTVMVALYREGPAIPGLAAALSALDWPATRLDVIILMEQDDDETLAAAQRAKWPMGTRLMVLPAGTPKTKPRALNYGFQHARGRYVCIYDAEDRPRPGQLRAAFAAFRTGGSTLACVQAPLVAFNRDQSWIADQWALEHAVQFSRLLPAQARLGLPLLLGGTSNHFDGLM